jgi:hypothetical protein
VERRTSERRLPDPAQGWLRIEKSGDNTICELCPVEGPIPTRKRGEYHVCWWEDERIVQYSPVLRAIRRVNKAFVVMIDWDGNEVNDA